MKTISPVSLNQTLNQTKFKPELTETLFHRPMPQTIIAQEVTDPDVMGQMGEYLTNFYESGQLWALLVGMVLGFVFRGIIGR